MIYLSEAKWASEENSSHLDNEVKQDKAWQIKAAPVAWVWVLTYRPRQSPENPRVSWLATTKGPSGYWQLERARPWWDRRWSTTTAIEESCTGVGRKVAGLNLGADQEFFCREISVDDHLPSFITYNHHKIFRMCEMFKVDCTTLYMWEM